MAEKRIKVAQHETNNPKYNIKVSVIYVDGGRNMLTGDYVERAYYCHVDRIERNNLGGVPYETLEMGAGTAFEIEPAKKFSQKKLETLAEALKNCMIYSADSYPLKGKVNYRPKIDQCTNHLLNKFKLTLGERIFPE